MVKKERIFGLSEKDQAQFEAEFKEKFKQAGGKEQEPPPVGDVIPPGTPIHLPSLEGLRAKSAGQGQQLELKEKDFEYYLTDWENNNRDYELTHLSQGTIIKPEREAYNLPIEFVDDLIEEAIKSDMKEDYRQLLFSILHNLDKIIIYNTASTIQIGLRDNERGLIRLYFEAKPPFAFRKVE